MKTKIFKLFFIVTVAFVAFNQAEANGCSFVRDLGVGMGGEDVRCLQQYLSDNGYNNNFSRFGVPDGIFGPLTRQAVIEWQASNGLPPTGYFDAVSKTRYFEISGGTYIVDGGYSPVIRDSREQKAMDRIREALEMIEEAEDEIEDSNINITKAKSLLEEAKDDMILAVNYFFVDRSFSKAYDRADDAYDNAEDAYDEAGGDSDKEDAEDLIDDVRDMIDDAEEDIEDADDDGADVDEAEDLLEDARDALEDAEDEFDDEDYDEALELAEEAEELVQDALDAIDW